MAAPVSDQHRPAGFDPARPADFDRRQVASGQDPVLVLLALYRAVAASQHLVREGHLLHAGL